jgi:hypothetical protein
VLSADVDVANSEELLFVAVEEDNRCQQEDVLCPIFNQQDAGGERLGS